MEYERKPDRSVNLVREDAPDAAYRIVDDLEMLLLKGHGKVRFEKARRDKGIVGSFYVEI